MHFHFERMKRNLVVEWNADRKMSVNCGDEKLLCPSTSLVKWHIGVLLPTSCETLNSEFLHEKEGGNKYHAVVREKVCFLLLKQWWCCLPFSTCYLLSNDNNWGQFPTKERTNIEVLILFNDAWAEITLVFWVVEHIAKNPKNLLRKWGGNINTVASLAKKLKGPVNLHGHLTKTL